MSDDSSSDSGSDYDLFVVSERRENPFRVSIITLNNVPVRMELDTGASASVLCEDTYKQIRQ